MMTRRLFGAVAIFGLGVWMSCAEDASPPTRAAPAQPGAAHPAAPSAKGGVQKAQSTSAASASVAGGQPVPAAVSKLLPASAASGNAYALVIVSQSGGGIYAQRNADWATRFHAYLTGKAGLAAGNVTVLAGDSDIGSACVNKKGATRDDVVAAFEKFRGRTRPEDQFTLILIGHGTPLVDPVTISMPGRDPDVEEMAEMLDALPAGKQIVLNFVSGAGNALKVFAKAGRVNLSAFSMNERNESVLAEFLLMALETGKADGCGADKGAGKADGVVTLLEAYHWSVRELVYWFHRQKGETTEGKNPKFIAMRVKGGECVRLFKKLHGGPPSTGKPPEGLPPGVMPLSNDSDATSPDAAGILSPEYGKPDAGDASEFGPMDWAGRRVLTEHALLEDCGVAPGVCALRSWAKLGASEQDNPKPWSPEDAWEWINGHKEGSAGYLAGRTVIGHPAWVPQ